MKKVIIILSVFALNTNLYSQNSLLRNQTVVDFILEYCKFKDANPIYQSKADTISGLLQKILAAETSEKRALRTKALEMLYENTAGTFEDGSDIYRMGRRRSLCFIALALLEDEYRYMAFLNDARNCLANITPNENHQKEFAKEYAIIDIIETLIRLNFDHSRTQIENDVEKLKRNILLLKEQNDAASKFISDYMNIVNIFIKKLDQLKK